MHTPGSANTANTSAIATTHADATDLAMSTGKLLRNTTQCPSVESVCASLGISRYSIWCAMCFRFQSNSRRVGVPRAVHLLAAGHILPGVWETAVVAQFWSLFIYHFCHTPLTSMDSRSAKARRNFLSTSGIRPMMALSRPSIASSIAFIVLHAGKVLGSQSADSKYDIGTTIFSPKGRLYQVEYAAQVQ